MRKCFHYTPVTELGCKVYSHYRIEDPEMIVRKPRPEDPNTAPDMYFFGNRHIPER